MSEITWEFPSAAPATPASTVPEGAVDHVTDALNRLPEQYRDDPNALALVSALVGPVQTLEDALQQLLLERTVDNAIGVQLTVIGKIVGQPRNGLDDDTYRRYIRARIKTNKSNGVAEDLIRIAKLVIADEDARMVIAHEGIAALVMRIDEVAVAPDVAAAAITFLRLAVSAGVRIILQYSADAPADVFRLDTGPGFDVGGHLADALT